MVIICCSVPCVLSVAFLFLFQFFIVSELVENELLSRNMYASYFVLYVQFNCDSPRCYRLIKYYLLKGVILKMKSWKEKTRCNG